MANGYWVSVFHPSISSEQAPWAVIRCGPEPTSQDSSREVSCRVRAVGEKYLSLTMYQISKPIFLSLLPQQAAVQAEICRVLSTHGHPTQ